MKEARAIASEQALERIRAHKGLLKVLKILPGDFTRVDYLLNQLLDPKNNRPIKPIDDTVDRTQYYDGVKKKWLSREVGERGQPKDTSYTKKTAVALSPKNGMIELYRPSGVHDRVGLLFDFDSSQVKDKYIFPKNARTDTRFWLKRKTGVAQPEITQIIALGDLERRDPFNAQLQNELLARLQLSGLTGVFSPDDKLRERLAALVLHAHIVKTTHIHLPVLIITSSKYVQVYAPDRQLTDLRLAMLLPAGSAEQAYSMQVQAIFPELDVSIPVDEPGVSVSESEQVDLERQLVQWYVDDRADGELLNFIKQQVKAHDLERFRLSFSYLAQEDPVFVTSWAKDQVSTVTSNRFESAYAYLKTSNPGVLSNILLDCFAEEEPNIAYRRLIDKGVHKQLTEEQWNGLLSRSVPYLNAGFFRDNCRPIDESVVQIGVVVKKGYYCSHDETWSYYTHYSGSIGFLLCCALLMADALDDVLWVMPDTAVVSALSQCSSLLSSVLTKTSNLSLYAIISGRNIWQRDLAKVQERLHNLAADRWVRLDQQGRKDLAQVLPGDKLVMVAKEALASARIPIVCQVRYDELTHGSLPPEVLSEIEEIYAKRMVELKRADLREVELSDFSGGVLMTGGSGTKLAYSAHSAERRFARK